MSLQRGCIFKISGIPAPLKELTFSQFFPESVRFSDRWNSGRISSRRVEIQQEFRNCCEGIPDRNSSTAVKTTRQACQRHGGGYIYIYMCVFVFYVPSSTPLSSKTHPFEVQTPRYGGLSSADKGRDKPLPSGIEGMFFFYERSLPRLLLTPSGLHFGVHFWAPPLPPPSLTASEAPLGRYLCTKWLWTSLGQNFRVILVPKWSPKGVHFAHMFSVWVYFLSCCFWICF